MPWVKQGRIFHLEMSPDRTSHCQVPTPYVMEDRVRVYYACRKDGMSFLTYFDLGKDLKTVLYSHEKPIMDLGKPGAFDSDGVMPSCVIPNGDELWLYYIGWNEKSKTARYHNVIGLAVSKDNGESFQRKFEGPIMDREPNEPYVAVMPFISKVNRGDGCDMWSMWYQSGTEWVKVGDKYEPIYVLKYACSYDGIDWHRSKEVSVPQNHPMEAFSRPSVIKEDGLYKTWYCFRGSEDYRGGEGSYKIGYAESINGVKFDRFDNHDIDRDEWDSNMQCYPFVGEIDGKKVMFYNGNDFGQTGIGLAIWE